MLSSPTSTIQNEQSPPPVRGNVALISGLIVLPFVLYIIGTVAGGGFGTELQQLAVAALQAFPFMILAILSYVGATQLWGKVSAVVFALLLVGGGALAVYLSGFVTLLDLSSPLPQIRQGAEPMLVALTLVAPIGPLIGLLGFIPAVRRALSRIIPLDPNSFVHTIMLVSIVGLTLSCFAPLLVLREPVLLTMVNSAAEQGADLASGRDSDGQLRDTLYGLFWIVPATIIAVGYGMQRTLGQALARLGFVRPTLKHVLLGIGTAVGLVFAATLLGVGLEWLWDAAGWPKTDNEAFGELMSFALSPIGAVVIGVTAGLGEELAVRGVLQPRAGILLSNLFFTSLHALQYNWDALLVVFLLGLVFGVIRKRTNTTTSAITHGVYNFILVLAAALQIPWFN